MLNMSGSPNMRKFKTTEARTMPTEMSFPNAPGLLCHPGKPRKHRRAQCKHRPADNEASAVNAVADYCHRVVGEQHAEAERQNVQCCGLFSRTVNGDERA